MNSKQKVPSRGVPKKSNFIEITRTPLDDCFCQGLPFAKSVDSHISHFLGQLVNDWNCVLLLIARLSKRVSASGDIGSSTPPPTKTKRSHTTSAVNESNRNRPYSYHPRESNITNKQNQNHTGSVEDLRTFTVPGVIEETDAEPSLGDNLNKQTISEISNQQNYKEGSKTQNISVHSETSQLDIATGDNPSSSQVKEEIQRSGSKNLLLCENLKGSSLPDNIAELSRNFITNEREKDRNNETFEHQSRLTQRLEEQSSEVIECEEEEGSDENEYFKLEPTVFETNVESERTPNEKNMVASAIQGIATNSEHGTSNPNDSQGVVPGKTDLNEKTEIVNTQSDEVKSYQFLIKTLRSSASQEPSQSSTHSQDFSQNDSFFQSASEDENENVTEIVNQSESMDNDVSETDVSEQNSEEENPNNEEISPADDDTLNEDEEGYTEVAHEFTHDSPSDESSGVEESYSPSYMTANGDNPIFRVNSCQRLIEVDSEVSESELPTTTETTNYQNTDTLEFSESNIRTTVNESQVIEPAIMTFSDLFMSNLASSKSYGDKPSSLPLKKTLELDPEQNERPNSQSSNTSSIFSTLEPRMASESSQISCQVLKAEIKPSNPKPEDLSEEIAPFTAVSENKEAHLNEISNQISVSREDNLLMRCSNELTVQHTELVNADSNEVNIQKTSNNLNQNIDNNDINSDKNITENLPIDHEEESVKDVRPEILSTNKDEESPPRPPPRRTGSRSASIPKDNQVLILTLPNEIKEIGTDLIYVPENLSNTGTLSSVRIKEVESGTDLTEANAKAPSISQKHSTPSIVSTNNTEALPSTPISAALVSTSLGSVSVQYPGGARPRDKKVYTPKSPQVNFKNEHQVKESSWIDFDSPVVIPKQTPKSKSSTHFPREINMDDSVGNIFDILKIQSSADKISTPSEIDTPPILPSKMKTQSEPSSQNQQVSERPDSRHQIAYRTDVPHGNSEQTFISAFKSTVNNEQNNLKQNDFASFTNQGRSSLDNTTSVNEIIGRAEIIPNEESSPMNADSFASDASRNNSSADITEQAPEVVPRSSPAFSRSSNTISGSLSREARRSVRRQKGSRHKQRPTLSDVSVAASVQIPPVLTAVNHPLSRLTNEDIPPPVPPRENNPKRLKDTADGHNTPPRTRSPNISSASRSRNTPMPPEPITPPRRVNRSKEQQRVKQTPKSMNRIAASGTGRPNPLRNNSGYNDDRLPSSKLTDQQHIQYILKYSN